MITVEFVVKLFCITFSLIGSNQGLLCYECTTLCTPRMSTADCDERHKVCRDPDLYFSTEVHKDLRKIKCEWNHMVCSKEKLTNSQGFVINRGCWNLTELCPLNVCVTLMRTSLSIFGFSEDYGEDGNDSTDGRADDLFQIQNSRRVCMCDTDSCNNEIGLSVTKGSFQHLQKNSVAQTQDIHWHVISTLFTWLAHS